MARGTWITVSARGLDDLVSELEKLADPSDCKEIFKGVCYYGAKVMADYMRNELKALKTSKQTKSNKNQKRYCSQREKDMLLKEMGVTPILDDEDGVNAKVGFDGYYENTKGQMVPIPLIANSVNKGTSFMRYQPFIGRTKRGGYPKAIDEMQRALDKEIQQRTK